MLYTENVEIVWGFVIISHLIFKWTISYIPVDAVSNTDYFWRIALVDVSLNSLVDVCQSCHRSYILFYLTVRPTKFVWKAADIVFTFCYTHFLRWAERLSVIILSLMLRLWYKKKLPCSSVSVSIKIWSRIGLIRFRAFLNMEWAQNATVRSSNIHELFWNCMVIFYAHVDFLQI